ncbi:PREDICTED: uncharacterized protein LOC105363418 [Ceratosolen solmsi marchali]|uniref:Uncharacterized protein LOC105363418 n=1 Tax=Ceratosolen solmsi marchali TaxID=326594 RepID=A0AAJ6YJV0_9HYME|nr:PREDICTED: uncharacterized protein LOC105363418 [Ceratosolen solmsi marchali]
MLFKLLFLISMSNILTPISSSKHVLRRDLNSVNFEKQLPSIEIRKENKRDDDIAKKLNIDDLEQLPRIDGSQEMVRDGNIRMVMQTMQKRFVNNRKEESHCCI